MNGSDAINPAEVAGQINIVIDANKDSVIVSGIHPLSVYTFCKIKDQRGNVGLGISGLIRTGFPS